MLEVDGEVEILVDTNIDVVASNTDIAIIEDTNDIEVTVNRQEYVITGDEIYIPKRYEDAPTWMQNLINEVVDISISAQIQDLNQISQSLESMIDAMEVAKNTYELSVISSNDIDERINTVVTTLNSAMNTADATILDVAQTRVTPEEASAITVDVITVELAKTEAGTLGATVSELQTAIADEESARSSSIEILTSSIEGAFDANATAINYINTYVGLDEVGASTGTGLSGYLEAPGGSIGGVGSQLHNDIQVGVDTAQSKFAYNSSVTLNGVTHNSGFGIATTIDSVHIPNGDSEFWVSANKFKVVGANQTADAQGPFTVNTTTGDVTFIGKVTFNSGQIGTLDEAIAQVVETVSVGDKNINITDNLIPTTSMVADIDNSGYQFVGNPVKSNAVGIGSYAEPQLSMVGGDEVYSLYVDEMTIPYYYRFGIKGVTSLGKFKIVTINSSDIVTYSVVSIELIDPLVPMVNTEWYMVDGIINPIGGDTAAKSGSIRLADGTKIASVTNFALPSGATKLLLGWYGASVISRMKLAKITADTLTSDYAPISYVDTSINSKVSSATVEDLAKRLGYLSYSDLVSKAELGQTIINGGHLRTSLIEANAITADLIDAYAIVGKYISGGTITGTQIIGSVIKGSFIDLTTTLTLTNWQQYTPATIPSAYVANFAHHNDGSLVADSQGYVRLPGQQNFLVAPVINSGTISGTTTRTLNTIYEIYSWDSYKVNTLNRSIRQDTSFTSTAELVFSGYGGGPIDQHEHAGYATNFSFVFLDKNISVNVSSFGSNDDTVANSSITFNGITVASASGSLGSGLDRPWDSGWLDYTTSIKGIPITIKTTIDINGAITFEFKAILSSTNKIVNHSVDDIIKINSVSVGGNTITRNLTYNINFPSIWVQ